MRAVAAHAKVLVLSAVCLLVLVLSASADWSTPEAVAPDVPDAQILAEYTRHCIAVDGSGAVHVAWRCMMSSGDAIYYNARTPGLGWGTESFRVSAPSAYEFEEPSICCNTQGDVFVAWGINDAVYYRGYRVATGWDADQALLDDYITLGSYHPSVAMDDAGNVHAVWVRAMAPTADRVVYKKMTPSEGWSDTLYLADADGTTSGVAVVEDQGSLHVVWDRCCYGSWESHVCYRGYTPGIGWDSTATVLDDVDGWRPSVAVDSQGCVHVVWITSPGEPVEVAYRRWAPGTGWDSLATTVSTVDGVPPEGPDVAVDDMGCVHVVWYESREGVYAGSWEVYERVLTPGIGWGDEVRLTDDPNSASVPHIASDNCGSIHMVYQSYLSALYMVNPGTGSSGISPVANPSSAGISSLPVTASPNPFRGTTTIGYCLPERTFATLEIYNVAGQAVAKLVNGMGSEGGHSISWDGLDFVGRPLQPGVYFARLQIAGHVATKPIVLIR